MNVWEEYRRLLLAKANRGEPLSATRVAVLCNVTRQAVQYWERRAVRKIRRRLEKRA